MDRRRLFGLLILGVVLLSNAQASDSDGDNEVCAT